MILLTNDDGIDAVGFRALFDATKDLGDICICAPLHEQSGKGVSITLDTPLWIHKHSWEGALECYSIAGTPADCMKIGLTRLFVDKKPSFVFSGINVGTNAGRNTLYSGTVGACIAATFLGISSVAFSCWDWEDPTYSHAQDLVKPIFELLKKAPLPSGTLLNVNTPPKRFGCKGLAIARQGMSFFTPNPSEHRDESGRLGYFLGGAFHKADEDSESDMHYLQQGIATISPVFVNELTCEQYFQTAKKFI